MAIHIVNIDGLLVLKQIGVQPELIAQMQAAEPPLKVQLKNKKIAVTKLGEEVWSTPIDAADLVMMQKGKLDAAKKSALHIKVVEGLVGLVGNQPILQTEKATVNPGDLTPASAANPFALDASTSATWSAKQPKWADTPASEMMVAARVQLIEADRMYQPVFGTNGSSRYFVVAGSSSVKIAARYISSTLSIRAEGPPSPGVTAALKSAGFKASKNGHMSVHFEIPDQGLASKTLGAILAAVAVEFETPVPQLARIAGKGA